MGLKTLSVLVICALCLLAPALLPTQWGVVSAETRSGTLLPGEHASFGIDDVQAMETITIDFTSDKPMDIYLMKKGAYNDYLLNRSFDTEWADEGRTSVEHEEEMGDGGDYVIVVDNADNARAGDTLPDGNATYEIKYEKKTFELGWEVYACCIGGVVAVVVVIIVIVWLFLRHKKKKAEQEAAMGYHAAYGPPGMGQGAIPAPYDGDDDYDDDYDDERRSRKKKKKRGRPRRDRHDDDDDDDDDDEDDDWDDDDDDDDDDYDDYEPGQRKKGKKPSSGKSRGSGDRGSKKAKRDRD